MMVKTRLALTAAALVATRVAVQEPRSGGSSPRRMTMRKLMLLLTSVVGLAAAGPVIAAAPAHTYRADLSCGPR